MRTIVVGGTWGTSPKKSSVIEKLASLLKSEEVYNGIGDISLFPNHPDGDLIIWMPDISNENKKHYPIKKPGAVLVCSKVMRDGYSKVDAVTRIFSMHGNAVIAVSRLGPVFCFELIDALGNTWFKGESIPELADAISLFYLFTKDAVRISSKWVKSDVQMIDDDYESISKLLSINSTLKDSIMNQCGSRFFGNISTRCQNLFPTSRIKNGIYVSPRNCDKAKLAPEDMILCTMGNGTVLYHKEIDIKPSVDTPIQIGVYDERPRLNFMIHGHAFLKKGGYPFYTRETENYCICGDMKEKDEILKIIPDGFNHGIINLRNHGFLAFSNELSNMETMFKTAKWEMTK